MAAVFLSRRLSVASTVSLCCLAGTIVVLPAIIRGEAPAAASESSISDDRWNDGRKVAIGQWQALRLGMFIHWGPVSLIGTEIGSSRGQEVAIEHYDQLHKQFYPEQFNAEEWVQIAKQAGMKYIVITTKHHDGFCLWPSDYTHFDIDETPWNQDVVEQLSTACRQANLSFGTYYSICDWWHPDYPLGSPYGRVRKSSTNMPRFFRYVKDQTAELLDRYEPEIMWFDGQWEEPWTDVYRDHLTRHMKELAPQTLINNRVGKAYDGTDGKTNQSSKNPGDFDTPEQHIGNFNRERPWETCMTLGTQWAWKPNDAIKTLRQCLRILLRTVGGDGNLLLNVGPMPDGRIEPRQAGRLLELGVWQSRFGHTVYETRGGPFKPGIWGASTCRDKKIYLFVMNWPYSKPLTLPAIDVNVLNVNCLTGGHAAVSTTGHVWTVELPAADRDETVTVIELTLDRETEGIIPVAVPDESGSLAFATRVEVSNVFEDLDEHSGAKLVDDDRHTRWATDASETTAWCTIDLGRTCSVQQVLIDEPVQFARVRAFKLETAVDSSWQTVHEGTTIGPELLLDIGPIVARRMRLSILESDNGPTLREFHIFGEISKGTRPD